MNSSPRAGSRMSSEPRTVSVIINTDGRADSLRVCLESLRYVRYPSFEVVVVAGPTNDGTWELCEALGDFIVFGRCPVRNLSKSRNMGIGLASGELLAFLDDDSIPEPEWLDDVVPAFDDPGVDVAGGFLHDHTGKGYQWTFGTSDRFGDADQHWNRPTPEFNFPKSFTFPFVMANSLFRHSTVADLGGFNEEFEYFLDENDMIVRIVDNGGIVTQLGNAFIHHKSLPSTMRYPNRVITSWYSMIKNKMYFSLLHGLEFAPISEIMHSTNKFIQMWRNHMRWAVGQGLLLPADAERFEREADSALRHGLARGLSGQQRLAAPELLRGRSSFTPFPKFRYPGGQACCILLSQAWQPDPPDAAARDVHERARHLAQAGAQVHVLTAGEGHDRIDFEDGMWVHRIVVQHSDKPASDAVSDAVWDFSRTMLDEAREIASRRPVAVVYVPPAAPQAGAAFAGSEFAVTSDADFWRTLPGAVPPAHRDCQDGRESANA